MKYIIICSVNLYGECNILLLPDLSGNFSPQEQCFKKIQEHSFCISSKLLFELSQVCFWGGQFLGFITGLSLLYLREAP